MTLCLINDVTLLYFKYVHHFTISIEGMQYHDQELLSTLTPSNIPKQKFFLNTHFIFRLSLSIHMSFSSALFPIFIHQGWISFLHLLNRPKKCLVIANVYIPMVRLTAGPEHIKKTLLLLSQRENVQIIHFVLFKYRVLSQSCQRQVAQGRRPDALGSP